MDELRASLLSIRRTNVYQQYYVPQQLLYKAMNRDALRETIKSSSIEFWKGRPTLENVLPGAQKTFAILILVGCPENILDFIEYAHSSRTTIDGKLPLTFKALSEYLLSSKAATEFLKLQWEFIAPIFDLNCILPRTFKDNIILPFHKDCPQKPVGQGAFGTIYPVAIDPQHQATPFKIVRKELDSNDRRNNYAAELRNIGILQMTSHPNILRLLSVYSYKGKHNFLFPFMEGGNLSDFFKSTVRPAKFESNADLFVAIAGLASAIRKVHLPSADQLKLIGFHRDLRPANVLVHDRKFILADFGISRMKEDPESTSTLFRAGKGCYLAPECQDQDGELFTKRKIRRSSDIWAFGCMIADLMTYMMRGSTALRNFELRRKQTIGNYSHHLFHNGVGGPNPNVDTWLTELGEEALKDHALFPVAKLSTLNLVREMLNIEESRRPQSPEVEMRLRAISIFALSQPIRAEMEDFYHKNPSIPALLDCLRFEGWLWAIGVTRLNNQTDFTRTWTGDSFAEYEIMVKCLRDLQDKLDTVKSGGDEKAQRKDFLPIRHLIDTLNSLLPCDLLEQARSFLEIKSLDSLQPQYLQDLEKGVVHHQLKLLSEMKRMQAWANKPQNSNVSSLKIERPPEKIVQKVEHLEIVKIQTQTPNEQILALAESKTYQDHWSEEKTGSELLSRLGGIAALLGLSSNQPKLRVLHCRGFYHQPSKFASSLVYDFPLNTTSNEVLTQGVSLRTLLTTTHDQDLHPTLDQKFQLALDLSTSLFEFHKLEWLHRSISSRNIIFFYKQAFAWDRATFRFLGFAHSRPDELTAHTEGPFRNSADEDDYYCDAAYLNGNRRFHLRDDYYGLGMLLLEMGLWRLLEAEMGTVHIDQRKRRVIETLVPRLGRLMGRKYMGAVMWCLHRGALEDAGGVVDGGEEARTEAGKIGTLRSRSVELRLEFKTEVVDVLQRCSV